MKKKLINNIRLQIQDYYPDVPFLFMEEKEYDDAIIGVMNGKGKGTSIAYDYDKVIRVNMDMGMSEEEAMEYFEYNQIDAYVGENTPVFITSIKNIVEN